MIMLIYCYYYRRSTLPVLLIGILVWSSVLTFSVISLHHYTDYVTKPIACILRHAEPPTTSASKTSDVSKS